MIVVAVIFFYLKMACYRVLIISVILLVKIASVDPKPWPGLSKFYQHLVDEIDRLQKIKQEEIARINKVNSIGSKGLNSRLEYRVMRLRYGHRLTTR